MGDVIRAAGGLVPRRTGRWGRPRLLLALAGLVPVTAGLLMLWLRPGPGTRCEEISVPAYFYPGATWTRAIDSQPAPAIMILDVTGTGAGSAPDRAYAAAVARARAAGIKVAAELTEEFVDLVQSLAQLRGNPAKLLIEAGVSDREVARRFRVTRIAEG